MWAVGGVEPSGHAQCNDTLDIVDSNGKVIASVRYLCMDNPANPAQTQSSVQFNGQTLLPVVNGVVSPDDFGNTVRGYGFDLSPSLGDYSRPSPAACTARHRRPPVR